jgi:hypothetical protein
MDAEERHGFEGDGFTYLKSPIWWAGIIACMHLELFVQEYLLTFWEVVVGEIANFAAYAFAPAILVTPLGALSVLIGAVLGSYFLKEELGTLGKLGCAICLIGSVIIVLHAPPDKDITTIDEILIYAIKPGLCPLEMHLENHLLILHSRLPNLLCGRGCICGSNDLPSCTKVREKEPFDFPLYLLDRWFCFRYVCQGIRNCRKIDSRW